MDVEDRDRRRGWANDQSMFASRTAWILVTNASGFLLGAASLFLIARLLGPESYGQLGLAQAWIGFLFAIGQLGMPAAMTFFAGRGRSLVSLEPIGLILTGTLSVVLIAIALVAAPLLEASLLQAAPLPLVNLALVALPCPFLMQFGAGVLYARGANLALNRIIVAQAALMLVLTIAFVGFAQAGVEGALVAYLVSSWAAAVACTWEVHRLTSLPDGRVGEPVSMREFTRYGIKLYPQNVMSFFSYRADVFLISWLVTNPAAPLGLYTLAVRIAEITFYVPNSVSAMLYPAISASNRQEADRMAPAVGRFTMLATSMAAVGILGAAFAGIWLFLPAYKGAFPALLVLMPGIMSLSLSKILASYLSGLGKPLPTATAATAALVANLALNLLLIPRWGIVGASCASLVSYTLQAVLLLGVASRWAGVSPDEFIVPRRAEFDRARALIAGLVARLRHPGRSAAATPIESIAEPQPIESHAQAIDAVPGPAGTGSEAAIDEVRGA